MNHLPIALAVLGTLTLPALGQVSFTAVTATPAGVFVQGPNPMFAGVPAGQNADSLFLLVPTIGGTPLSNLRCITAPTAQGVPGFAISSLVLTSLPATAMGTTTATGPAGATLGRPEFLITMLAPAGTTGRLDVRNSLSSFGTPLTTTHEVSVDIGDDGTVEFLASSTVSATLPVAVDATGRLVIRVAIENHMTLPPPPFALHLRGTSFDARFIPDPLATCTISTYGTSCGGAQAAASEVTLGFARTITLLGTGGFGNAPMVALFGDQNTGPTLPGGCALLTNALGSTLLIADRFGHASARYNLPATAVGNVYLQMVPFDLQGGALVVRASNGVQVDCAP